MMEQRGHAPFGRYHAALRDLYGGEERMAETTEITFLL